MMLAAAPGTSAVTKTTKKKATTKKVAATTKAVATTAPAATAAPVTTAAGPKVVSGLGTGPAPSTVHIGYAGGYSLSFLPMIMAQGAGYFDEISTRFKTKVVVDIYGSGILAEPAFLAGDAQFLVIGANSWMPAVLQGKDQVAIFNEQNSIGIIMSAAVKHKATKGTDMAKFDGATWCQTGPVGTSATSIKLSMGLAGLNPAKQTIVSVGGVSAFTPALASGRCDINSQDTTSAAQQDLDGIGYVVANYNDPALSEKLAGIIFGIPLTTSNAFAEKYPELTQAIVNAAVKGLTTIQKSIDNPNTLYEKLPSDMKKQTTPGLFAQALSYYGPGYSYRLNSGLFSNQGATDTIGLIRATNGIPKDANPDPAKLWTNKFVLQAYTDLGLTPSKDAQNGPATLDSKLGKPSVDLSSLS